MKGLKLEPGCRHAWVTWLNLFLLKSKPPTSARIAPSCGVIEISAPSSCGNWVIDHAPCASFRSIIWLEQILGLRIQRRQEAARHRRDSPAARFQWPGRAPGAYPATQ